MPNAVASNSTDPPLATPLIRRAVVDDLPSIERLLAENALPLDGVRATIQTLFVAVADDRLAGVAGLELCERHALLRSVAVRAEWRAHGVGHALVARAIAEGEARGLDALFLLTTTEVRFFPRFQFETITRDKVPADIRATDEFRSACPASATVMRRALTPS